MGTSAKYRGRLAPSPTGALHLGNIRTFMIAWLRARSLGGEIVFRMEDLDHPKTKPGAEAQAMEDLRWLGFDWDEGPDVGGPFAPYVQSRRRELYAEALARLVRDGRAYPCVCARRDVESAQSAPHAGETLFDPGTCRYYMCIPVQGHPRDCTEIDTVIARKILSVTWHGQVTDLGERTLTLAESARERGLTPTGWFHLKVTSPMAHRLPGKKGDNILQMGCIVE